MDMLLTLPVLLALALGSAGVAGAWWYRKNLSRVAVPLRGERANAARARQGQGGKAGSGAGRSGRRGGNVSPEALDTLMDWEPVATRVLTTGERDAYHVLRKALPEHMILAQVPVARFIKVPTENPYNEWLRRVGPLGDELVVCYLPSQDRAC